MSATDVLEGRKEGISGQLPVASSRLPVAGSQFEAAGIESPQGLKPEAEVRGCGTAEAVPFQKLSEAKVRELEEFWTKEPKQAAAKTAKEKKLAKERKLLAKHIDVLDTMGKTMDFVVPQFSILERGRRRKVGGREYLMEYVLKIRNKNGRLQALHVNAAQRDFAQTAGKRSIVLKARQLGITTYVAARFFVHTITRPGTLSVQVAHDQHSAEEIFRMVHRFLENLPERLQAERRCARRGANVRRSCFRGSTASTAWRQRRTRMPGRGLTIQNLHCSEVARWPGDAAATSGGTAGGGAAGGRDRAGIDPNGACGAFYAEWQRAEETGYVRHFFPWWWEPSYERPVGIVELTDEELALMRKYGLDGGADRVPDAKMRANFGTRVCGRVSRKMRRAAFGAAANASSTWRRSSTGCSEPRRPWVTKTTAAAGVLPPQEGKRVHHRRGPGGGQCGWRLLVRAGIGRASGMQCAELRGHLRSAGNWRAKVAECWRGGYNGALVAVERNNHGHAVLAQMETIQEYGNLVCRAEEQAGWLTTSVDRPPMLRTAGGDAAGAAPELFSSRRLLEECRTFVRASGWNEAGGDGAHDDTVMAMAIALAVRAEKAGEASLARAVEVGTL